jgi:hypothetical protein
MATYDRGIGRRKLMACETPGCSTNCTYAYSCHDVRMGKADVIFWPLLALVVFGVVAAIVNVVA